MLLRIEDLRIEAMGRPVPSPLVKGVSLEVARGEVLGLIGESGAGKSTIGLAALGYVRPGCRATTGRVLVEGIDLLAMPERARRRLRGRRLAYIAQNAGSSFNPAQTLVRQICETPVREGLMSATEARRAGVALFRRLLLPDPERFGERYPHQVSGGQLQRAMAAMAMIARPDLLVLDEPTTALDVTTQVEFLAIVRDLIRQEGVAALYISHDLAVVAQLAGRIAVLRQGALEEEGSTAQMLSSPRSAYAAALVAARHLEPAAARPMAASAAALIEARDITARYPTGPTVLDKAALRIAPGETLAVVGESGSGKSSLARVLVGLLRPASGTVIYRGRAIPELARRDLATRRALQLIHQQPDLALNPRERIIDIIGRPLKLFLDVPRGRRALRVTELLERVGLPPEFAGRYPGALSGGEKQRVCIARALAAEPELLICDEVTASLDALIAKDIVELLRQLGRDTGLACLLITHDFELVNAMADRVAVMQDGRIVEEGARVQVTEQPRAAYTMRLLAAVPQLRQGWLDSVAPPAAG